MPNELGSTDAGVLMECRDALRATITAFEYQERLAEFCEVSAQTVSQWVKRGYLPLKHVEIISKELDVPPADLRPDYAAILSDRSCRRGRARKSNHN